VANWGVHLFDAMRWALDEEAPASLSTHGGRFAIDDDRTIPDTLEAIFEFASGRLMVWGQYEATGGPAVRNGEIEFRGTKGNLYSSESGYVITPSRGGQFQDPEPRMKPEEVRVERRERNLAGLHIRNFIDCVKSRQTPNCDIEVGHRSNTFALLANIALETRSPFSVLSSPRASPPKTRGRRSSGSLTDQSSGASALNKSGFGHGLRISALSRFATDWIRTTWTGYPLRPKRAWIGTIPDGS
jgi:hypothetical protein